MKTASLEDRIAALREEIEAAIFERAKELKKTCEGVPENVLYNVLTRSSDCKCTAWIRIKESDL